MNKTNTIDIKGTPNKCSEHSQEIRLGSGPHAYRLWCTECDKHTQWINQSQAEALLDLMEDQI